MAPEIGRGGSLGRKRRPREAPPAAAFCGRDANRKPPSPPPLRTTRRQRVSTRETYALLPGAPAVASSRARRWRVFSYLTKRAEALKRARLWQAIARRAGLQLPSATVLTFSRCRRTCQAVAVRCRLYPELQSVFLLSGRQWQRERSSRLRDVATVPAGTISCAR
eukprot:364222-Chlamydomonas_euryale.AAC.10